MKWFLAPFYKGHVSVLCEKCVYLAQEKSILLTDEQEEALASWDGDACCQSCGRSVETGDVP